jgi:hypothetical protein
MFVPWGLSHQSDKATPVLPIYYDVVSKTFGGRAMIGLVVLNGCRTLQLTQGRNALIDEDDWGRVGSIRWNLQRGGNNYYASHNKAANSRRDGRRRWTRLMLHRLVLGVEGKPFVDHKNGDGLDNRKANLRVATHSENQRNRRPCLSKSRFKGVFPKGRRWRSQIGLNGRSIHLGTFDKEEDAARAYDRAAIEHFGEFALTNADLLWPY